MKNGLQIEKMGNYVKMDVSIEIMAKIMGNNAITCLRETDPEKKKDLETESERLSKERKQMYAGDKEIIEKIFEVYRQITKGKIL